MSSNNKDSSSPIPLGQHNSASPSTNGRRKRPTRSACAPKPIEATSRDGQPKDDGSDPNGCEDDNSDDYSNDDSDSDDDNDVDEPPKKKKKTGRKLECHLFHSIYLFSHY